MKRSFLVGCLFIILLFSLGCNSSADNTKYIDFKKTVPVATTAVIPKDNNALRVAIASVLLPQDTVVHYRAISDYLGNKLGRQIILVQKNSYAEIALLLLNGGADMAFFSSGGYANYSGFNGIELLASQQRMGLPYYQGYLLVNSDSDISSIEGLRGKTVAFTDPLSYSGHTFLVQELRKRGFTPENFLGRYLYTDSHDASFKAVVNKVVDAAPVSRIVYDRALISNPSIIRQVNIIAVSPAAGIGPVVAGKSLTVGEKKILRENLLNLHENVDMQKALHGLSIDRYVAPQPELFDPIRKMLTETGEKP
jgi:ABC-type phosphate/phosphonate transport system, periplasmic component